LAGDTGAALVAVTGLPGTGKSTVSNAVASHLRATLLPLSWVLGALGDVGTPRERVAPAAYMVLTRLARVQLEGGGSVVLDAMAGSEAVRCEWRDVASAAGARFVGVECVCPDRDVHRRRVEERIEHVPGWATPGWDHVERMRARYESWTSERIVIDALEPLEHNVGAILRAAGQTSGGKTGR